MRSAHLVALDLKSDDIRERRPVPVAHARVADCSDERQVLLELLDLVLALLCSVTG
jgi:hypothetical protein